jgi:alginate O-acetyltransferase complex protein AlgI
MFFTSLDFLLFFIVAVGVFYALPHRFRWMFLLVASYFYYMWLDPRYGILIGTMTIVVYTTTFAMHGKRQSVKKLLVAVSLVFCLSILFILKYYNFFNNSLRDLFALLGIAYSAPVFSLLMPIGISFYTFQALSYTIDIYRGTRAPEKNFGIFALYVSFFPVLLSGPIERSTTLLPQFYKKVEFDYDRVTNGLKLMAWGFFQKLVIADRLSVYVSMVYGQPQLLHGLPLLVATYFFGVQAYCDFAGYTDIAIGTAQVMGYDLLPNFRRPFFSQSISEYWRRWHMTLISWFRDYLYIPLGGNRVSTFRWYLNIMIVFTLSGLWHGAQWTFVSWGAMNGVFIIVSRLTQTSRDWLREHIFGSLAKIPAAVYFSLSAAPIAFGALGGMAGVAGTGTRIAAVAGGLVLSVLGILKIKSDTFMRFLDGAKKFWMIFVTFHLFIFGAIFFRAKSLTDAWYVLTHIPGTNFSEIKLIFKIDEMLWMVGLIIFLFIVQFVQEKRGSIRAILGKKPLLIRWTLYYLFVMLIFLGMYKTAQFIYFQF